MLPANDVCSVQNIASVEIEAIDIFGFVGTVANKVDCEAGLPSGFVAVSTIPRNGFHSITMDLSRDLNVINCQLFCEMFLAASSASNSFVS